MHAGLTVFSMFTTSGHKQHKHKYLLKYRILSVFSICKSISEAEARHSVLAQLQLSGGCLSKSCIRMQIFTGVVVKGCCQPALQSNIGTDVRHSVFEHCCSSFTFAAFMTLTSIIISSSYDSHVQNVNIHRACRSQIG